MVGYIYKTTNLTNGKIYIGQKYSNKFIKNYFGSEYGKKKGEQVFYATENKH